MKQDPNVLVTQDQPRVSYDVNTFRVVRIQDKPFVTLTFILVRVVCNVWGTKPKQSLVSQWTNGILVSRRNITSQQIWKGRCGLEFTCFVDKSWSFVGYCLITTYTKHVVNTSISMDRSSWRSCEHGFTCLTLSFSFKKTQMTRIKICFRSRTSLHIEFKKMSNISPTLPRGLCDYRYIWYFVNVC